PDLMLLFYLHCPPTPETYTLSLHDALPIYRESGGGPVRRSGRARRRPRQRPARLPFRPGRPHVHGRRRAHLSHVRAGAGGAEDLDRKSTRLNSSHVSSSYAVFCLKNKKNTK